MAKPASAIQVENLRQFQAAARRSVDTELPKRLGQANKEIGALVIRRLNPAPDRTAVGEGAGASVRPSASKREVLLRVGGKHRGHQDPEVTRMRQWGKRVVRGFRPAPPRPHILGTVEENRDEISKRWLEAVADAMGWEAD